MSDSPQQPDSADWRRKAALRLAFRIVAASFFWTCAAAVAYFGIPGAITVSKGAEEIVISYTNLAIAGLSGAAGATLYPVFRLIFKVVFELFAEANACLIKGEIPKKEDTLAAFMIIMVWKKITQRYLHKPAQRLIGRFSYPLTFANRVSRRAIWGKSGVAAAFAVLAAVAFMVPWDLGGFPWALLAVAVWYLSDAALIEIRRRLGNYGGTPTEALEAAQYVIARMRKGGDGSGPNEPIFNEARKAHRAEAPSGALGAGR